MAIDGMRAGGVKPLVDRTYREGGTFQWVRETYINCIQANATRIAFSIEWTGVTSRRVYRRLIADNGTGMTSVELVSFINVFGGGGKPIGGEHDNYGVGSKTSLLPWNKTGIVIVSYVGGEASMIRLRYDEETDEYGLHMFEATDENGEPTLDTVVEPFDDTLGETGVDWTQVAPGWLTQEGHGTVLVLLGNSLGDDTILGAPDRKENATKGVLSYLNSRIWEVPDHVDVTVDVMSSSDKASWPEDPSGVNRRSVRGAKHYVEWATRGSVEAHGTAVLAGGIKAHWWLRDETDLALDYAQSRGFTGVLYRNELYNVSNHHSTYRAFGLINAGVRSRVYVVLEPPLASDGVDGVYPNTSRNGLLLRDSTGLHSGDGVPVSEWAGLWADHMPAEVRAAVAAAMSSSGDSSAVDEALRQKIAARFSSRWRVLRLRVKVGGADSVTATAAGTEPREGMPRSKRRSRCSPGGTGGTRGAINIGSSQGPAPAAKTMVAGDLPRWQSGTAEDVGDEWALATYSGHGSATGQPVVIINAEHAVMRAQIEHYQAQFSPAHAEDVANEVLNVYGLVAATKVAHAESLRAMAAPSIIDEMHSNAALTGALLGLYAEDQVITARLGGKFSRARAIA